MAAAPQAGRPAQASGGTVNGRPRLSVIVITRNAGRHLAACLASVDFADECVVLDSGSDDDTLAIARAHGARVECSADWPGFGAQKNRVLALASGDWVLSLDADECVTPELAQEILQVLAAPAHVAYDMPRLSKFCGRYMRHGGWWPDRVLRLFRRGQARFTDARVHEKLVAEGSVGHLRWHLLHDTHADLDEAIAKINRYSTDSAQVLHARGKRANLPGAVGHGVWTFIRMYFLRLGLLDGRHGFVLATVTAMGSYARYAKLMFLNDEARRERATPPR
ncbi:glycosyltransferase family 2 protein [Verticiella sediminum]|uniref:Glycosyltransferase family 2 protein n=1 Tax=Verticiella sediminum TaxID=1247510 RepID=A0A556AYY8_9BURK|nr:glycosyltransferase family 2 protein [Verticiella sediminum]TSH98160.1 glycosyltransferase family 2 protein [Verticiella sediminum]